MKKSRSRKEVITEDKEKQWYIPPSHGIPTYNSNNDPNCRVARIGQYNLQQKAKIDSMADTDNGRTAEWIKQKLTKTYDDIPIRIHVNLSSKAIDEAKYLPAHGTGPSPAEVEILQKIIIRERLLRELTKLTRSSSDIMSVLGEVSELLKALRFETVDIVESISTWQSFQPTPRPFLYKGMNYLLKLSCDLDFLDQHEEVIERFCFEFKSNPFAYRGGGNIITGTGTKNSEQYLHGLTQTLRANYNNMTAVDGIDIVRLHNGEKIIQAEFNRLAQQSNATFGLHTSTEGLLLYEGSSVGEGGDSGQLTTGMLSTTSQSSPQQQQQQPSSSSEQQYAPTSSSTDKKHKHNNSNNSKSEFSFNPKKLKLERIATLEEEADELSAVIAHIKEQIDTLVDEYKSTVTKRKQLERRQQEAVITGRDLASQHLAAEIIVIKSDLLSLTTRVRDLQREHYFVTLERRRKLGVVRTMRTEMDEEKRKAALKKLIEDTIKREGLGAALLLLNTDKATAMAKLTPITRQTPSSSSATPHSTNTSEKKVKKKSKKSSRKKKRKAMREKHATAMGLRNSQSTPTAAISAAEEEDADEDGDDEEEDDDGEDDDEENFSNDHLQQLETLHESSQELDIHAEVAVDFDRLDLGDDVATNDNISLDHINAAYDASSNDRKSSDQDDKRGEEAYINSINATIEDQHDVEYYLQLQERQAAGLLTSFDDNNEGGSGDGIDQGVSYISGDEDDYYHHNSEHQDQAQGLEGEQIQEQLQENVAVGSGFSVAKALKSSRIPNTTEQQLDEQDGDDLAT